MKKIWIVISIVVVVALTIVFVVTQTKKEPEVIKIGAILPLTGDMAVFGESFKSGIDLAVDELNKEKGIHGRKLLVIYEDDRGKGDVAVSAFRKLVTSDKVECIIGGVMSSTAMPIAPIAQKEKVVLLSPTATAPSLSQFKDYFFRIQPSDVFEGEIMSEFASKQLKAKKVGVFYVNNDWGSGLAEVFRSKFKFLGGNIPIIESYSLGDTDFRSQLTKIKSVNPEYIYLLGYLKELSIILKQMREMSVKSRILSAYSFYDPKLIEVAGDIAEDAIFTMPTYDPESKDPIVSSFANRYVARYGKKPDQFAAHAYDCMRILAKVMENGALKGSEINSALHKLRNYPSVTGIITFSEENGDVTKPLRLFTVKNREFIPYK